MRDSKTGISTCNAASLVDGVMEAEVPAGGTVEQASAPVMRPPSLMDSILHYTQAKQYPAERPFLFTLRKCVIRSAVGQTGRNGPLGRDYTLNDLVMLGGDRLAPSTGEAVLHQEGRAPPPERGASRAVTPTGDDPQSTRGTSPRRPRPLAIHRARHVFPLLSA